MHYNYLQIFNIHVTLLCLYYYSQALSFLTQNITDVSDTGVAYTTVGKHIPRQSVDYHGGDGTPTVSVLGAEHVVWLE